MSIVYGYNAVPTNDPYVQYAEQGMKAITKAADSKRAALLGLFPFRRSPHRMCYSLTEPPSSPETTYMDAGLIQSGSGSGKVLRDWVSESSFWNGVGTNGTHFLLSPH